MHAHDPDDELPGSAAASSAGDPLEQARMLIAAEEQQRMRQCAAEVEEVLTKYDMRLQVTPAQISIVPN